ncbi:hypothetical protein MACK_002124 [Theileria orientalis]|uniref:Uncharacterized protein n=1 Tax=Theileria orientalis TaxID=68886 RepID=A0A976MBN5_THEOR|nr:hypothetical protein MACK_002124 [Theileria orientalis]
MTLNTYGGTFVGFKAIREGELKSKSGSPNEDKSPYPTLDEKPDKVIVTLIGVDNLKLPEVTHPNKRELVVTAIFDEDSIEESLTHVRQNSEIVDAQFLHDSYSANFNSYQLVLPCDDKKVLSLYLSCVTTLFMEDGTKRIEFKGHSYTRTIELSTCLDHKQIREELMLSDESYIPGVKLSFRLVTTKKELGPEVNEDRICSVLEKYKKSDD